MSASRWKGRFELAWIGIVPVLALGLCAAHVPARWRWLGLFIPLQGLLSAWLVRKTLDLLNRVALQDLVSTTLVAIMATSGVGVSAWESARLRDESLAKSDRTPFFPMPILDESSLPEEREFVETYHRLRQENRGVWPWIRGRVPYWDSPCPEMLWMLELVAAGALAGTAWRMRRTTDDDAAQPRN